MEREHFRPSTRAALAQNTRVWKGVTDRRAAGQEQSIACRVVLAVSRVAMKLVLVRGTCAWQLHEILNGLELGIRRIHEQGVIVFLNRVLFLNHVFDELFDHQLLKQLFDYECTSAREVLDFSSWPEGRSLL